MVCEVRCTNATRSFVNADIHTRIELIVPDELEAEVVAATQSHAHTERKGDGRIFVTDVQRTIMIRSGEVEE